MKIKPFKVYHKKLKKVYEVEAIDWVTNDIRLLNSDDEGNPIIVDFQEVDLIKE